MTETVIRVAGIDYVCSGAVWYEIDTDDDRHVRLGASASALAQELATLRAQLAGVRERVEKLDRYDPIVDCNEPYMEHTERGDYFSCADVLAALGGDA